MGKATPGPDLDRPVQCRDSATARRQYGLAGKDALGLGGFRGYAVSLQTPPILNGLRPINFEQEVLMRLMTAMALALIVSVASFGQIAPNILPAMVFQQSINVQDAFGNLVILDFGSVVTSNGVSAGSTGGGIGIGRPFIRAPKVRVTVLRPNATDSVVYDGGFQFIGVGQRAIYGLLTTRPPGTTPATRSLIAIVTAQSLPVTTSGFPSLAITGSPEPRMIAPDVISLVDGPVSVGPTLIPTRIRTAAIVNFNGSAFVVASQRSVP